MSCANESSVDPHRRRSRWVAAIAVTVLALLVVPVGPTGRAQAAEPDTILGLTNQSRAAVGLGPLSRDGAMDQVALNWANQMAASGSMSHNPSFSVQIPGGWSNAAENVAHGHANGAAMHQGWMNSPGHRENILGDYTAIGIAFVSAGGTTWGVEVFAKYGASVVAPAPPPPPAPLPPPAPAPIAPPPAPAAAAPPPAVPEAPLTLPEGSTSAAVPRGSPPAELESARHDAARVAVIASLRASDRRSDPEAAGAVLTPYAPAAPRDVMVGLAAIVITLAVAGSVVMLPRRRTTSSKAAPRLREP